MVRQLQRIFVQRFVNIRRSGGGKGPDLTTTLEPITETTLNNTNTTEVTVTEPSTTEEPSTTVPSSLSEKETKSTSPAVSETSTDATTTTKPLPETTITESTTMENTSSTETNETSNTDPPKLFVDVNRSVDEKLFPQENPTGRKLLSTFSWPKTIDEEEDKDDTDLSILYFKRNSLLNRMPHSNIPRRS
ncbi:myb-like protein U isoform X4 [Stegodyphus dumicola]|uniref:myb-like protein U isoform X4 n=1 Tax=Stegodyphus dumicola TaxID=202533 RepID=UPI0015AB411F|nr:myb-like protein U isoform X4 [Stegodyphus dumicola]